MKIIMKIDKITNGNPEIYFMDIQKKVVEKNLN